MRTMTMMVLLFFVTSCKQTTIPSQPRAVEAAALVPVEQPVPKWSEDFGVCAEADWSTAMTCVGEGCSSSALGEGCVACVRDAARCVDERSDGCAARCSACLGEARCQFLEQNLRHAERILEQGASDAPEADAVHRIGVPIVKEVVGAAADGSTIVGGVGDRAATETVVFDARGREMWRVEDCSGHRPANGAVSGEGRWYGVVCHDELRVFELATGFLRFTRPGKGRPSFGGDRAVAFEEPNGELQWLDLLEGEEKTLPNRSVWSFAVSPDGRRIAFPSQPVTVVSVDAPQKPILSLDEYADAVVWHDSQTIAVLRTRELRHIDVASGEVVYTAELEDAYSWELASTPLGAAVASTSEYRNEGLFYRSPKSAASRLLKTLEPPLGRGNVTWTRGTFTAADGWAVMADGRVAVGSSEFGMVIFRNDGSRVNFELARGPIHWLNPGSTPDELIYGTVTGPWAIDLKSGVRERLRVPQEFHLREVRAYQDWLIGLGTDMGEEPRPNAKIWVGKRDGSTVATVDAGEEPWTATIGKSGQLHVAGPGKLRTFDLASSREVASVDIGNANTAAFSHDATYVVVASTPSTFDRNVGPPNAVVYRTSDYTEVASFEATSCTFAARTNVLGCRIPTAAGGEMDLVSIEIPSERILHTASGTLLGPEVVAVADNGGQVLTGSPTMSWQSGTLWDLAGGPGRSVSADQQIFSKDHKLITVNREFVVVNPSLSEL